MRTFIVLWFGLLQAFISGAAHAALVGDPTDSEVALLPEYCKHAQAFKEKYGTQEGHKQWLDRLGPTYLALHHYCWALIAIQRSLKPGVTKQDRDFNLRSAAADIYYVVERADASFVLLPEILTRRGESLRKLRDFPNAESSYRRAIEVKPDYWPAHLGLAQSYVDRGDRAAARKQLEQSIPQVSDARMLKKMLADLQRSP